MTKKETKKTSTAITTATQKTNYDMVMNQFFNIDFSAMNTIIDNLANRNSLSEVEKTEANAIIDTWNENVINKLNIEEERIANFVAAITGTSATDGIPALIKTQNFIPELETLIAVTGLDKEYADICDTVTEYTMAESTYYNIPKLTDDDLDTTQGEKIIMQRDHEYAVAKARAEVTKLGNKLIRQNNDITSKLMANPDIKKLVNKLKRRQSSMKRMATTCTDKAQLAKINITIDDPSVRDSLKELIALTTMQHEHR